jgi:hypothetical protein
VQERNARDLVETGVDRAGPHGFDAFAVVVQLDLNEVGHAAVSRIADRFATVYARWMRLLALAALTSTACAVTPTTTTSLFDGTTLAGWRGDSCCWSVRDGAIVGKTDGTLAHNTFLIREGSFDNFTLSLSFRLVNLNSGVQFRSRVVDENGFVVAGDQADIADDSHMATLFDERGRGLLAGALVKPPLAEWNAYVIHADGPHVTLALNGVTTVDYVEKDPSAATSGVIALQLHIGPSMEVDFRKIEISPP